MMIRDEAVHFFFFFTHRHLPPILGEILMHIIKSCWCTLPEKPGSQDPWLKSYCLKYWSTYNNNENGIPGERTVWHFLPCKLLLITDRQSPHITPRGLFSLSSLVMMIQPCVRSRHGMAFLFSTHSRNTYFLILSPSSLSGRKNSNDL